MGTSLKHTTECFHQSRKITNADTANTTIEILTSSASDRRIYGIAVFNDNNSIQQLRVILVNGGNEHIAFTISAALGAGANGTANAKDLFGDSSATSMFQKQIDANGMPYFNLPAGWSIGVRYYVALSGTTTIHVFGETY